MGRFTDHGESKGFIKELFQKLQSNLNAEQVKNFANLEDDEARYKFISQNSCLKEFEVTRNASIKNHKLAMDFKQKGNKGFQSQNWLSALDFYNKALLLLPPENGNPSCFRLFHSICSEIALFILNSTLKLILISMFNSMLNVPLDFGR